MGKQIINHVEEKNKIVLYYHNCGGYFVTHTLGSTEHYLDDTQYKLKIRLLTVLSLVIILI